MRKNYVSTSKQLSTLENSADLTYFCTTELFRAFTRLLFFVNIEDSVVLGKCGDIFHLPQSKGGGGIIIIQWLGTRDLAEHQVLPRVAPQQRVTQPQILIVQS